MIRWIFGILAGMLIMISILFGQLMFTIGNRPESEEPKVEPEYHLQILIQDTDEYFWTLFKEGAKAAESELGLYVEFVSVSQKNVEDLKSIVEMGTIAGVDGIALQAADSEQTIAVIKEAKEQGVEIITYENGNYIIPETPMVGSNNYNIGSIAGDMAVNAANGEGEVVVIINDAGNESDIPYQNLIIQGIIDSFSRYSTMNVNKIYTLNKDMFEVEKIVSNIIAGTDPVDLIVCLDESSTPGVAQVLVDNNMVGDIQLIGYGVMPQTIDYIKRGVIYGTVVPNSYEIGYQTVKQLTKNVQGEQISDSVSTELYTIDADNVNYYEEKLK
ncbi:MAG: sugar transporter substrate-binding protein [Lachnospiraceae bacterium]|jgi:ribose transport system substrate-binding protein|nr:sugar transporter substrate-binding protein [Lachnospiraceae bacterium]